MIRLMKENGEMDKGMSGRYMKSDLLTLPDGTSAYALSSGSLHSQASRLGCSSQTCGAFDVSGLVDTLVDWLRSPPPSKYNLRFFCSTVQKPEKWLSARERMPV